MLETPSQGEFHGTLTFNLADAYALTELPTRSPDLRPLLESRDARQLMPSVNPSEPAPAWSLTRILHYATAGLLIIGVLAFWYLQPPALNPMADPQAAKALALVQTHQASDAPTLLQAIANRVKTMSERGQGVRLGEWQVQQRGERTYMVRIWLREEGTTQWFERDYSWQVDLDRRSIRPMSNFAVELMPRNRSSSHSTPLTGSQN